jgi:hypothetical protein
LACADGYDFVRGQPVHSISLNVESGNQILAPNYVHGQWHGQVTKTREKSLNFNARGRNIYPPQAGAYAMMPWLVLAWCVVPLLVTMINPRLVERVKSGFLVSSRGA